MSSHHFVKEDQEPALVLACPFSLPDLSPFLEWSPLIVALPEATDSVLLSGIKTDVVMVTPSELQTRSMHFEHQMPVRIITLEPEGNALATALEFLSSTGRLQVNVWCVGAESFLPVAESFIEQLEVTLADGQYRWSAIRSGHYSKWYPRDTALKIKGNSGFRVLSPNTEARGDSVRVTADGVVRLSSDQFFWVGESRDNFLPG